MALGRVTLVAGSGSLYHLLLPFSGRRLSPVSLSPVVVAFASGAVSEEILPLAHLTALICPTFLFQTVPDGSDQILPLPAFVCLKLIAHGAPPDPHKRGVF